MPSSFELLLLELACLGETDWRVDRITSAAGPEFIVWLLRGGRAHVESLSAAEISAQRVALLKRVLLEVQAQADWLLASEPELINGQPLNPVTALGRTRHENANLRDRLALVEAQHAAALQKLAAFESSTSWRITAPLRRVIDGVRRYQRQWNSAGCEELTCLRFGELCKTPHFFNAQSAVVPWTSPTTAFSAYRAALFFLWKAAFPCYCAPPTLPPFLMK